jgi:diguanylate cyclase (GGDEF)-like protein/PAS domain S-box-containing protein
MKSDFDELVYRSIVESSMDAVVIINHSGDIIWWNAAAERMFGYDSSEVIGKYVHDILPAHDLREKADNSFNIFKSKGTGPLIGKSLLVRGLRKNGDEFHVQFSPNTVEVKGELYVFAFLRDVSDLVSLQEKLKHQATIDELTGILNRRAFLQQAEAAYNMSTRHKEPLTLLMMDIDFFKKINDQYGHHAGDIALQKFAKNISEITRTEDIFGRVGGEEFFLALIKTPIDIASYLAERIRLATEGLTITTSDLSFTLTVSIGITSIEKGDQSLQEMQNRCDEALYKAKKTGRNRVVLSGS